MKRQRTWMLPVFLLLLAVSPASARKWTDDTGRYSIEAELVEVKDGKVWLRKADGTIVAVPLTKLSKSDRDYLESLGKSGTVSDVPTEPAPPAEEISPGRKEAIAALRKLLQDEDMGIRRIAAESLEQTEGKP